MSTKSGHKRFYGIVEYPYWILCFALSDWLFLSYSIVLWEILPEMVYFPFRIYGNGKALRMSIPIGSNR